jgi:vacuolar-type H+-ATPase subunit I/STV1|tara:strand:+ start:3142 stop:3354 length:213 start_codon:yes stop_codon:yes gene_type:complete
MKLSDVPEFQPKATVEDLDKQRDTIEQRLDRIEQKLDKLSTILDKHISFIDETYEGLRNPINAAKKWLGR